MFDNDGVFYSNNPKNIFNDNWLLDQEKILNLKKNSFVILDFSTEHYGESGLDHVYHALDANGLNFLLLVYDPADHKKFDRMLFYPHWYYFGKKNFVLSDNDALPKTYKWSCLNYNPRPHRIYNYIYSQQKPYFESAWFSFHREDYMNGHLRFDDVILDEDVLEKWNQCKEELDRHCFTSSYNGTRDDARCDLPANADAYIHLVTETCVTQKIFVSEKTWKPIASKQIFLVFGNAGTVSYLRDQGVDVFDDLIDHSYDHEADWKTRLHMIHNQLEKLINTDLHDVYINTQDRRTANQEKFFSGQFDQKYHIEVLECINTLK